MTEKKRGLGRGLGELGLTELLSDMGVGVAVAPEVVAPASADAAVAPVPTVIEKSGALRELPLDKLRPGRYQPRKDMNQEALEELAQSIRAQGVIQPIIVRRMNDGYEIIAGERRWRAAQLAGIEKIPAVIRDISDETAVAVALIENIQRRDLNAIEEAVALHRLLTEFKLTHQEVAEAVGKSRTVVTNLLRLLKLNPEVRALVEKGSLEMGHARALLALEGTQQNEVAHRVVAQALSVRQTEQLIRHLQNKTPQPQGSKTMDPDIAALQKTLSDKLGAEVSFQHSAKGKGKLIIHYHSVDELDGILERIQ